MDRPVSSLTWGPPHPCKQALKSVFNAVRLAQLEERRSADREIVSSNPGRTINQGL